MYHTFFSTKIGVALHLRVWNLNLSRQDNKMSWMLFQNAATYLFFFFWEHCKLFKLQRQKSDKTSCLSELPKSFIPLYRGSLEGPFLSLSFPTPSLLLDQDDLEPSKQLQMAMNFGCVHLHLQSTDITQCSMMPGFVPCRRPRVSHTHR